MTAIEYFRNTVGDAEFTQEEADSLTAYIKSRVPRQPDIEAVTEFLHQEWCDADLAEMKAYCSDYQQRQALFSEAEFRQAFLVGFRRGKYPA